MEMKRLNRQVLNAVSTFSIDGVISTFEIIKSDYPELYEELLAKGVEVAASTGKNKIIQLLISLGARCDYADNYAIRKTIANGNVEGTRMLLSEYGVNPNAGNGMAIVVAIEKNFYKTLELVFSSLGDVNGRCGDYATLAIEHGTVDIFRLLVRCRIRVPPHDETLS